MALAAVQDELAEARVQAGANREATLSMFRQIAMLVEDQEQRRQEAESLRRQLVASTLPAAPASTRQHPHVSTYCNPKEWSDHLTTTRFPQLHVRR